MFHVLFIIASYLPLSFLNLFLKLFIYFLFFLSLLDKNLTRSSYSISIFLTSNFLSFNQGKDKHAMCRDRGPKLAIRP